GVLVPLEQKTGISVITLIIVVIPIILPRLEPLSCHIMGCNAYSSVKRWLRPPSASPKNFPEWKDNFAETPKSHHKSAKITTPFSQNSGVFYTRGQTVI
ncbi:MAG: hypothetical protein ACIWVG_05270, partial [Gloeotrichia echinulata HAB0833]